MEECEALASFFNETCIQIVLSNPRRKGEIKKISLRPVIISEGLYFQQTSYIGAKVYHKNLSRDQAVEKTEQALRKEFKQCQIITETEMVVILSNKRGEFSFRTKEKQTERKQGDMEHNRKKKYILEEGTPVPFLKDLGVMTAEGKIVHSKYDKYKQINRFLEFVEDILPELPQGREITLLDFGCGKSYLTFAVYYYLKVLKQYDLRVIGLDLKEDVIEHCNNLKEKYGYEKLQFLKGDIASYQGVDKADIVITLHACDTATDYALEKAVTWGAKVILSVPCCQHELNNQIKNNILRPVLKYGIIKERMAALLTDAIRAEYLESRGYRTQLLEFIDMEHTPKNILIRGIFHGKAADNREQIKEIEEFFHISPTLGKLLDKGNCV
ncbi:MAG: SAM-dependent methyltransferase [Lachnospiraceae bacterium]|nr:SAM-dependent methyltransferase [Lachnospiraceae bacterium]